MNGGIRPSTCCGAGTSGRIAVRQSGCQTPDGSRRRKNCGGRSPRSAYPQNPAGSPPRRARTPPHHSQPRKTGTEQYCRRGLGDRGDIAGANRPSEEPVTLGVSIDLAAGADIHSPRIGRRIWRIGGTRPVPIGLKIYDYIVRTETIPFPRPTICAIAEDAVVTLVGPRS